MINFGLLFTFPVLKFTNLIIIKNKNPKHSHNFILVYYAIHSHFIILPNNSIYKANFCVVKLV